MTENRLAGNLLAAVLTLAVNAYAQTVSTDATGVTIDHGTKLTRVEIWGDRIARVLHTPTTSLPATSSLAVTGGSAVAAWQFQDNGDHVLLTAPHFTARVETASGQVSFLDPSSAQILSEAAGGTTLTPTTVGSPATASHVVTQKFELPAGEAIYGLGQHQEGIMNWVGESVTLLQENKHVAVPVSLSNKGYALLWDNPAVTTVDAGKTTAGQLSWSSEAGDTVDYYFCYGPEPDEAIAGYRALTGSAPMFGKWAWGFWQCKERYTSQSELLGVANQYRTLGIPIDGIIQDWQYWPSLNHSTATGGWGSHEFDPARYPDPTAMMNTLHGQNIHALISVWAKFDVTNSGVSIPNLQELEAVGAAFNPAIPYVYPAGQGKWLDPFNADGRQVYWNQLSQKIFSKGLDGWWLDASEAELSGNWGEFRNFNTALGSGAKVYNAYPLMETTAVYQGQRAETSAKRALILTRSAWAGQQRNASITWSGDIGANWDTFAKQIPAGLNFTATGIPYWNTDIGGFFSGNPATASYAELFTRWFQYGAFCPMFRVHGTNYAKEVWRFPADTQPILKDFINLRYHLLPYIYSTSWKVTNEDYTMMRPLVMDFRTDPQAQGIGDQFMFGPSLLVNPVTSAGATSRSVYLPDGTQWIDFWSGLKQDGGQTVQASAPIEKLPLYVRAGSILPYGPSIQYAMESVDPIELRVYTGADGGFTLYEDEGDNYNYESGTHATIPFTWDETSGQLTIGARQGSFPGMLANRTFKVVFVSPMHGAGLDTTASPDEVVSYDGSAVTVTAPPLPDLPAAPSGLSATANDGGISLSWTGPTEGTVYHFQRALQSGGPYVTIANPVVGASLVDTDVEAGNTYYYVVSAINAAGEGPVSSEVPATNGAAALRALFMFNAVSGTAAADGSGRGWHATLVNGPTRVAGKGGNAVDLDGADDHVSLPANVVATLNNLTISTWVHLNAATTWSRIFDFGSGEDSYMYLTPNGGGAVRFAITTSGGSGEETISGTSVLSTGAWAHVAVTLSENLGVLYVNGVEAGRNETMSLKPLDLGASTQNWIGRSQYAADPYLDGRVDDFRIYSGALSAADILALANGHAGALLAPWTSEDIGTPTIPGSSGNGDAGTSALHLTASGSDIWDNSDQFRFTWQTRSGDTEFITRVDALDTADPWSKAGLMVRASTSDNAVNCLLAITPSNGVTFQSRTTAGGNTAYTQTTGITAPYWLKIARVGNAFTAYRSADGTAWTQHASVTLSNMPAIANFGLALTSHTNSAPAGVSFSSIAFVDPPPPIPVTGSLTTPVTDEDDCYFLTTNLNDGDNIDGTGIESGDNDESTYVAADRSSKGQTFSTGSNPTGYTFQSFSFQHVIWPVYLDNGTWYDIQPGDTFEYQIGTLFDTVKTPIHTGVAQYSGSAITRSAQGTSGSGNFLTFDLSGAGLAPLSPNTTYYFEIAPAAGDAYFELNGAKTGDYTDGMAFRGNDGPEDGIIGTGVVSLTGDRIFHAALTALPSPDFSNWINGFPDVGGQNGYTDDPDGDGLKNGVENFFGTNPSAPNTGITEVAKNGNTITFRHPQNPILASDVTGTYQWSTDLVTFHDDGAASGGTTVTFSPSENDPVSGITTVTVMVSGEAPARLFAVVSARLAVP